MHDMTAGTRSRLYAEFAQFYADERCPWAPTNPKRVFKLAFEWVYPRFEDRLSEEEFAAVMYATLGFAGAKPRGLFATFDTTRYSGPLAPDDHFVNLFRNQLVWRVGDWLRGQNERQGTGARVHQCGRGRMERFPERGTRYDRAERQRVDALPEGLRRLGAAERDVVRLAYWGPYSLREVAVELGLDRGTVRRRHDAAVDRLRAFFGVPEKFAG